MTRPARSYLYVPGDRADRLASADSRGADALIADLEDAVAPDAKAMARAEVGNWLADTGRSQRWVRVNVDSLAEDLDAVVTPALSGIVVPKGEPDRLRDVAARLDALESERGIEAGSIALLPLIETGSGLLEVATSARLPRVHRLGLGEADLAADLGLVTDESRSEFAPLRLQVVVASAAAGIGRPIGPTSTAFRDLDAFRASAHVLYRLGFRARTAIHPAQLAVIHDVFTPSPEDVARARDLVERFEAAGGGGTVDADGRFIDLAVVRSAREVLATAGL